MNFPLKTNSGYQIQHISRVSKERQHSLTQFLHKTGMRQVDDLHRIEKSWTHRRLSKSGFSRNKRFIPGKGLGFGFSTYLGVRWNFAATEPEFKHFADFDGSVSLPSETLRLRGDSIHQNRHDPNGSLPLLRSQEEEEAEPMRKTRRRQ